MNSAPKNWDFHSLAPVDNANEGEGDGDVDGRDGEH